MIGERLKELRKKNGYTQVTLADNLGVSKGTVAMWETDKRMPDFDKLNELCDLFDVRLDYLTGRSEDASSPRLSEEGIDQLGRWAIADDYSETLRMYASLDSYGKAAVDALIRSERLRCLDQDTLEKTDKTKIRVMIEK
ncbi:MAG: helix-turn-helix domain-containing protein [Clostridia bacterium]|jgi:transcriptional regulator with XRE-family HTH domain|nr:helix-turn-helix domain-containing protein [Lachnospiraceae bacterium]MCI1930479.1 helix-turn-helix domain-containing protein [Clostridia bacterium]MCH4029203.1 helix-turn-helix domain-containing protein [Lachnospiraceae bacterium]MCH4067059.1 helix-turn-helix domain-containing protein [Lachnospiraceae bacterium]MCH4113084.1 helix-turn-helix domain-containing protein [Lachnospiraceae bacterium]